jgi:CRISPR-associated protein Csx17
MDYTVNFMENVVNLLVAPKKRPVRSLLMNTLFDSPTAGLEAIAVGQYDPGRAGGANQGAGVTTDALANPWTALLTMEGAVVWAGGVYRRQGAGFRSYLCSPFTVRPSMVGFGSASVKDEETARAEVWAPLWRRPSRYEEIRALFREGRASVDDKPARTGLDFAKAVGSLGTDRGIGQFVRFTMLKRRGDSYVAPPLGVFDNQQRRVADLIGELDPTLRAMDGSAKDSSGEAPASWKSARRQVDEALYQTLLRDDPEQFLALVAAIGDCQKWLLRRGKQVQPSLTQSWIERCLDVREYRAEVRIAAALSGIRHPNLGPLADNLTNDGTNFAWVGRSLPERMIATLEKRVWMGEGTERSSLWSRSRATRTDVKAFLKGSTDDDLLERLMFAFTLVKHAGEQRREVDRTALPPLFCAVKLLFGGTAAVSSDDESITFEPDGRVPRLLRAGRANEAWQIARTRMLVNGLMPIDGQFAELSQEEGARYAAALLIPLADMKDLLGTVLQSRPETGDRE